MAWTHSAGQWIGTALSAAACGYTLISFAAVLIARSARRRGSSRRAVSVLKPLCGVEPGLYASLRSFCLQDHPEFEIIFGVRSADDPAVKVVNALQREFPRVSLRLVIGAREFGRNPKVSNLMNMLPFARHSHLVIADSDIEVRFDYLRRVCAPLHDARVGVVTCPYAGVPQHGLWARLAADFINGWFIPSVYVAALFGSRAFAFGSTLALRREVLDEIGGLGAIVDELADDYRLGELTRRAGYETVLSNVVVSTAVTERGLKDVIDHQLRWLRTIRTVRPTGYALACITFAGPAAFGGWLLSPGSWTLAALVVCLSGRCTVQLFSPNPNRRRFEWWLPWASELLTFALWWVSFSSRQVLWRGVGFEVARDGTVTPAVCSHPSIDPVLNTAAATRNGWPRRHSRIFTG